MRNQTPEPDFDGCLTVHDGVTYNQYRLYTDPSDTTWGCITRGQRGFGASLWARTREEPGLPIDKVVAGHGPLTLVPDAFYDASDDELSALVAEALSNPY